MHATRIYVSTTVHSRTTSKNLPVKQRLVSFVVLVLLFLRRGTRETKQKTKQKIRARVCNEPPQGTVRMSDSNYFARRRPRMGSSPARQGRSPLRIFARCALVARRRGLGHAQCHRGCSKNPPFNSATSPPLPSSHLLRTPHSHPQQTFSANAAVARFAVVALSLKRRAPIQSSRYYRACASVRA